MSENKLNYTLSVPVADIDTLLSAIAYAAQMHGNQKRKHTNEPYINHCISVLKLTYDYTNSLDAALIAVLHDIIEDTSAIANDIKAQWGSKISEGVSILTNTPANNLINRARRKAIDRARIADSNEMLQTIKMFDILDNIPSLKQYEPKFFHTVFKKEIIEDILTFTKVDTKIAFRVLAALNR